MLEFCLQNDGVEPPKRSSSVCGLPQKAGHISHRPHQQQKGHPIGCPFCCWYGRLVLELLPPDRTSKFAVGVMAAEKKVGFCQQNDAVQASRPSSSVCGLPQKAGQMSHRPHQQKKSPPIGGLFFCVDTAAVRP